MYIIIKKSYRSFLVGWLVVFYVWLVGFFVCSDSCLIVIPLVSASIFTECSTQETSICGKLTVHIQIGIFVEIETWLSPIQTYLKILIYAINVGPAILNLRKIENFTVIEVFEHTTLLLQWYSYLIMMGNKIFQLRVPTIN